MGKSLWMSCLCVLCVLSSACAGQSRRVAVLQPMSAVGFRPFTTDSHDWYWSSPDGRRVAYLARVDGGQVLVVGGIPSPKYQEIYWHTIRFGPSGDRLLYTAKRDGQVHLIVDGHESPPYIWVDPPIFSPDGAHMAYRAELARRQFQVVSDGKVGPTFSAISELHYCPDGRLVYMARRKEKECYAVIDGEQVGPYVDIHSDIACSPDGKHLAYWVTDDRTDLVHFTLIQDGAEGPTYYGYPEWLTFSPDSQHLAYVANHDGKRRLVLDGKEIAGYPGTPYISPPLFSPDSAHLVSTVRLGNQVRLLLDGKEVVSAADIADIQYCGNRLAYRLVEDKRERVVMGDTAYPWRTVSAVWPEGAHDLWIACYMGRWRTFFGGTEGLPDNFSRGLQCTSDGQHWAYPVRFGNKEAMLVDNRLGLPFTAVGVPFFSPDGMRLGYPVYNGKQFAMVVDGERGPWYRTLDSPAFSPDSRRVAYPTYTKQDATVVIDGKNGMSFSEILAKGNPWNGIQLTFDAPDCLHYLARRGQQLYLVREYLLPAASPNTFTYFENGYQTVSREQLRQTEAQAVQGGHMPWHADVLYAAQVMSMSLLPVVPPGKTTDIRFTPHGAGRDLRVASGRWEAVYRLVSETTTAAQVDVFVNGRRWYRLTLARPFGHWWYLTGITTVSAE